MFHCFSSPYYVQIAHGMDQKGEGGRGGGCIYFRAVRTEASRVLKQNAWISQKKNPFKKYNTCSVPLCCKCAYFICEMPFLKHGWFCCVSIWEIFPPSGYCFEREKKKFPSSKLTLLSSEKCVWRRLQLKLFVVMPEGRQRKRGEKELNYGSFKWK